MHNRTATHRSWKYSPAKAQRLQDATGVPYAEVGGWLDSLGGFLEDVGDVAKDIVTSDVTKVVAGGLAVVFPPVGVPAAAALVAANGVVEAVDAAQDARRKVSRAGRRIRGKGKARGRGRGRGKVSPAGSRAVLKSKVAKAIVKTTAKAAKAGDKDAQRGLFILRVARRMKEARKLIAKRRLLQQKRELRSARAKGRLATRLKGRVRRKRATAKLRERAKRGKLASGLLLTADGEALRGKFIEVGRCE